MKHVVVVAAVMMVLAGCVQPPGEDQRPPDTVDVRPLPTPTEPDPVDAVDTLSADPAAASTLEERQARAASLRLRVTGARMSGLMVGSGFAIDDHTVITNAHVVEGGDQVQMATWDGYDVDATVEEFTVEHDLAVLTTDQPVPSDPLDLADADPADGEEVTVVGFPDGGRVRVDSDARVIHTFEGEIHAGEAGDGSHAIDGVADTASPDRIVRLDADSVRRGSSGGPVLNASGDLVGVVFALDAKTGDALAVPVSTLRSWLERV